MISKEEKERCFTQWKAGEALAEAMIPLIGRLYRESNVVTSIYGRPLINRSVIALLKAHRFVRQLEGEPLAVEDSYPILMALAELDLAPARIDVGRLAFRYAHLQSQMSVHEFLQKEVLTVLKNQPVVYASSCDVVLYGFGRIGRLLARILIEKAGSGQALRLRAIVVRKNGDNDLLKRASLLRRDSIHGSFQGTITVDEESSALIVNGNYIHVIYAKTPDSIDYTEYGIQQALIVDNTGQWRDESGLSQHLRCPGASRVVLTAPGKGEIKNIVYGVNHETVSDVDLIVSAASCTTNAIVPVLKVIHEQFGIASGHMETVHAYTNDQNLIDNYHQGNRRGRSAPLNLVITETGAAKAVAKALPELSGKLTGNAIRVPTPNVSMAILNLTLEREMSKSELNDYLRRIALSSSLKNQIDYVNSHEVVSSDFVGSRHACIVDAQSTIVSGNRCVLYIWYDNEFGYSCQVVRLLENMAGAVSPSIPAE